MDRIRMWISIEDKMPQKEDVYFVAYDEVEYGAIYYTAAMHQYWKRTVKYWMEIPELPCDKDVMDDREEKARRRNQG